MSLIHAVGSKNPLRTAGIPKEFHAPVRLKKDEHNKRLDKALRAYLKDLDERVSKGHNICLFGDNGLGKTTRVVIIAKRAMKIKKRVKFIPAVTLAGIVSMTWDAKKKSDWGRVKALENLWKSLLRCDVLVIDDFNRKMIPINSATVQALEFTIKTRLDNHKATFITTNHTRREFKREFGESVFSWLKGNPKNPAIFATVHGVDYRKAKEVQA